MYVHLESGSTNDGCWSGYTPSCGYNAAGYGETPSDPCSTYQPPQSGYLFIYYWLLCTLTIFNFLEGCKKCQYSSIRF